MRSAIERKGNKTMGFPQGYKNDLALELARLSEAAYTQYHHFVSGQPWNVPSGYVLEQTMTTVYETGNPPIGFIASKESDLFVVWRGTSDATEWLVDAKFDQTPCSFLAEGQLVELGFHELYTTHSHTVDSPQTTVLNHIEESGDKFASLYVTGHSLGGALAVLNAAELASKSAASNPVMYTFAGPRVGNPSFVQSFNELVRTSWRVVNEHDEVPKIPPTAMGTDGYEHVGREVPISFGGSLPWEWGKDHSLLNYIKQLESLGASR